MCQSCLPLSAKIFCKNYIDFGKPSVLIEPSSDLQLTITGVNSGLSWKFGQLGQNTLEYKHLSLRPSLKNYLFAITQLTVHKLDRMGQILNMN